ncbi:MAG: arylamine N-acetyltransferase [Pseudomonadales bacterium]|nr:arylamine N-acetyltransferase [Pseudomonadales bacterium]
MKWLNLLERADYLGSTDPTLETLEAIQRQCLLNIAFENLDIHLGKKIRLDSPGIYQKIVKSKRGGFCYELNELLLQCLTELGFSCTRVEARVNFLDQPKPFAHQTCLVQLDDLWLSDIGFGDSSIVPINLSHGEKQFDGVSWYYVKPDAQGMFEIFHSDDPETEANSWTSVLSVNPTPQPWTAFKKMCIYTQTSPESIFTQQRLCTRLTQDGRITLAGNTLKIRHASNISEEAVSEENYSAVLAELFDIHLDKHEWIKLEVETRS